MITLEAAESIVAGTYIDWDGEQGNQCWDWAQWYYDQCVRSTGVLWTVPGAEHPGYACGSWEGYAVNGLSADFAQISPDQPAQFGDIVICAWGSRSYPVSHVFVALADAGSQIYSLSQNSSPARPDLPGYSTKSSGPVVRQYLPKDNIAGYLRPWANINTASSAGGVGAASDTVKPIEQPKEWDEMASKDEIKDAIREVTKEGYGIVDGVWFRPIKGWNGEVSAEARLLGMDAALNGPGGAVNGRLDALIGETVALRAAVSALATGAGVTPEQIDKSIKDALAGFSITLNAAAK